LKKFFSDTNVNVLCKEPILDAPLAFISSYIFDDDTVLTALQNVPITKVGRKAIHMKSAILQTFQEL
jgi:hypothetical protein